MKSTPLVSIALGLVAGAAGTAAMDAFQKRLTRATSTGGEDAEGGEPPKRWSDAPAPAQIGQRVAEGVFQRKVPVEHAAGMTQAVHWTYGTAWGAAYGILHSSIRGGSLAHGLVFGTGVFAAAYVVLPAARIYKPIWEYSPSTVSKDLAQHLVYGLGVAGAYRALARL